MVVWELWVFGAYLFHIGVWVAAVFNNDNLVSPSLLTLLGIKETENSYPAMMIYGIVLVGYCTSQTIQNSFLIDTWTNGDNQTNA